jgi:hypothetical protein
MGFPLLFLCRDLTTCCSVGDGNVWIAAARLLACFDFEEVEVGGLFDPLESMCCRV